MKKCKGKQYTKFLNSSAIYKLKMTVFRGLTLLLLCIIFLSFGSEIEGFRYSLNSYARKSVSSTQLKSTRRNRPEAPVKETITYVVGENIPEDILKQNAIYDMILVERFNQPEKLGSENESSNVLWHYQHRLF